MYKWATPRTGLGVYGVSGVYLVAHGVYSNEPQGPHAMYCSCASWML